MAEGDMAKMREEPAAHTIEIRTEPLDRPARNSMGGWPFLDDAPGPRGLGAQTFKLGGTPSWAQDPEHYRCACGADLVYLCQVPEGMEFAVHPGRPEQPYGVGADTYNLFLGDEVYLLACPDHCDPAAVWPVNQN